MFESQANKTIRKYAEWFLYNNCNDLEPKQLNELRQALTMTLGTEADTTTKYIYKEPTDANDAPVAEAIVCLPCPINELPFIWSTDYFGGCRMIGNTEQVYISWDGDALVISGCSALYDDDSTMFDASYIHWCKADKDGEIIYNPFAKQFLHVIEHVQEMFDNNNK